MYKILLLVFLSGVANAYDGTVKDKYNKVHGYWNTTENNNKEYINKTGIRMYTISEDGEIKDKYGKTIGYIVKGKIK